MIIAGLPVALAAAPLATASAAERPEPILALPEQDAAEEIAIALLDHPDVKAIKAGLLAYLLETEIGRTGDGAATAERAVECLTNSLIFKELSSYRAEPFLIWGTEDTPREWRGRKLGCVGTAGDNPDNIYRSAGIEGGVRYEVTGRFDTKNRAAQLIFQAGPGEPGIAPNLATAGSEAVEVLGAFTDRDLTIAPDGTFRLTIGGESGAANHVKTPPGPVSIGFRDTLSDWKQQPAWLSIRRLDADAPQPFDRDELRRRIVGRMGDYTRRWSEFAKYGFGGLQPNTHSQPTGRAGGWGFVMGMRFSLAEDEALAVTISAKDAQYLGFQVVDPWTIAPDARKYQTSLNNAQVTPDRDGNFTYVIAPEDPGVANWLDTAGLHDGFGIVRWQGTPAGATSEGLLRSFRIIKRKEAVRLPGVAKISARQRKAQLEQRAKEWANRLR